MSEQTVEQEPKRGQVEQAIRRHLSNGDTAAAFRELAIRADRDHKRLMELARCYDALRAVQEPAAFNNTEHAGKMKGGVAAIYGQWPGDETDEQIQAGLDAVDGKPEPQPDHSADASKMVQPDPQPAFKGSIVSRDLYLDTRPQPARPVGLQFGDRVEHAVLGDGVFLEVSKQDEGWCYVAFKKAGYAMYAAVAHLTRLSSDRERAEAAERELEYYKMSLREEEQACRDWKEINTKLEEQLTQARADIKGWASRASKAEESCHLLRVDTEVEYGGLEFGSLVMPTEDSGLPQEVGVVIGHSSDNDETVKVCWPSVQRWCNISALCYSRSAEASRSGFLQYVGEGWNRAKSAEARVRELEGIIGQPVNLQKWRKWKERAEAAGVKARDLEQKLESIQRALSNLAWNYGGKWFFRSCIIPSSPEITDSLVLEGIKAAYKHDSDATPAEARCERCEKVREAFKDGSREPAEALRACAKHFRRVCIDSDYLDKGWVAYLERAAVAISAATPQRGENGTEVPND